MAELYPVIPGTVVEEDYCFVGPGRVYYAAEGYLSVGQSISVLWQEGDYYYIRYTDSTTGITKQAYYVHDQIQTVYGTASPNALDVIPVPECFRYIEENVVVYNAPGALNIGSLNLCETVKYIGATVDGYSLVEYDITGNEDGMRKRGWVDASKLGAMPNPTGTVYASTRGGIPVSQQDANARFIYDYLRAYGFNHNSACGVLGNVYQECTMNPALWDVVINDVPDITEAYGIFQWDPATNYLRRAVTLGMIPSMTAAAMDCFVNESSENKKALMLSQLEYMLAGCFAKFQWYKPSGNYANKMTIQEFMVSNKTPEELAVIFHDHFERSSQPQMENRTYWAGEYSERFQ